MRSHCVVICVLFEIFLSFQPIQSLLSRRFVTFEYRSVTTMASCSKDNSNAKCEPCSGLDDNALMFQEDVKQRLLQASKASPALAAWNLKETKVEGKSVPVLSFSFIAKNFQAALHAINEMAAIAERERHHPDFHLVNYRNVEVNLCTHKLGGITENDILMAEMISDEVKITYSPKWLKEHPEAAPSSK